MATIQARTSRGNKYWYIVESRRVNGKPRPIMLAYLGKANDLLFRLQGITNCVKLKSYSHGAIAALLKVAAELDICHTINKYIKSERKYTSEKPIRHNLTAGATFLLAAIGRLCTPTSKDGFYGWAKYTSLEYLLKTNLSKIDSQHFWDLMDALPIENIDIVEQEILQNVIEIYHPNSQSLFFDTTNFFTYIHTTNEKCTIAKRGRNKQKRADLRQIGLAMVVTKEDMIPLFHLTYDGNQHDSKVFRSVIEKLRARMSCLKLDIGSHTVIFDRGNNSKENLKLLKNEGLHYVGALTPYQHKELINQAMESFETIKIGEKAWQIYRTKQDIWGEERTVIVFVSENLKAGQIGWILQVIAKAEKELNKLQKKAFSEPMNQKEKEALESKIKKLLQEKKIDEYVGWSLQEMGKNTYQLNYAINQENLKKIEDKLGMRIIMTDRHDWNTEEIINAYHGQSHIEQAFKNIKNPYHLAVRPQYHWTDQKIKVHYFICILGYLLATLIWKTAKEKTNFNGTLDNFLDSLNHIRLGAILESTEKRGAIKAVYKLEEMSEDEWLLLKSLNIEESHINRPKLPGVGVYT
jgi:transposase